MYSERISSGLSPGAKERIVSYLGRMDREEEKRREDLTRGRQN